MPDICLYLQAHQPYRLASFRYFDIGAGADPFDDAANAAIVRRVAERCYMPVFQLLQERVDSTAGRFRFALGASGTLLEQLEQWAPATLRALQSLVASGGVELLGETYHHSLAALTDPSEFFSQVELHQHLLRRLFGARPRTFRNTELIYSDEIAPFVRQLGFRGVLVEGVPEVLGTRSPNHVYAATTSGLRLIPRHFQLSDDIAFRYGHAQLGAGRPAAVRYADWLAAAEGESVHLFMDIETFGEHLPSSSGILEFLGALVEECEERGLGFVTPGELSTREPHGILSMPGASSWADTERDTSAWLGGRLQRLAHERLYALRNLVDATGDDSLLDRWRRLTTSDHLYYMSTKLYEDGAVHRYFNPHGTPYDAFIRYMNVLEDLERQGLEATAPFPYGAASFPGMAVTG